MTDSDSSSPSSDSGEDSDDDKYRRHQDVVKIDLKKKIEDEIARRVEAAFPETPPIEKIRRRQEALKQQQLAKKQDLNAHLDFSNNHYVKNCIAKIRSELQSHYRFNDGNARDNSKIDASAEEEQEEETQMFEETKKEIKFFQPTVKFIQNEYINATADSLPFDLNSLLPLLPSPNLLPIILNCAEPLYTAMKYVIGATTFENQVTPYSHHLRCSGLVYDSVRSPKEQTPDKPSNPLVAPNLLFESRFESGNLRQARRVGQFEYDLVLSTDIFTKRHTQWFYFKVQNMIPGIIYKFRIVNLLKKDSLYNHGMKPLVYSDLKAKRNGIGWARQGHHISYSRNTHHLSSPLLSRDMIYYQMEWQMEFPYLNDTCYVAHCYPFTYSDLTKDIKDMLADSLKRRFVHNDVLCHTRAGHECPLLTITNFDKYQSHRRCVVLTARVHPGESNSSWMMKGVYDFLTSSEPEAKELRKNFIFKLVPMINPDGVIVGNYRCSIQGKDLNRNYRWPNKNKFPEIWHIKQLVENLSATNGVFAYCDFHGHSRKSNVFMYGNSSYTGKAAFSVVDYLNERLLPFILHRLDPEMFSFEDSRFSIKKCKEATGRVVMFQQYGIANSFTMEATFSGTKASQSDSRHYNQRDFMDTGVLFCRGLLEYSKVHNNKARENEIMVALTKSIAFRLLSLEAKKTEVDNRNKSPLGLTEVEEIEVKSLPGSPIKDLHTNDTDIDGRAIIFVKEAVNGDPAGEIKIAAMTSINQTYKQINDLLSQQTVGVEDCIKVLENLSLSALSCEDTGSSDSDSESEPEIKPDEEKKTKVIKKKKKIKVNPKKAKSTSGKSLAFRKEKTKTRKKPKKAKSADPVATRTANNVSATNFIKTTENILPVINSPKVLVAEGVRKEDRTTSGFLESELRAHKDVNQSFTTSALGNTKLGDGWANPYKGRRNGGIPCYSEERSIERATRKMAEIQKKVEDRIQKQKEFMSYLPLDLMSSEYVTSMNLDLQKLNNLQQQTKVIQESFEQSIRVLSHSFGHGVEHHSSNDGASSNGRRFSRWHFCDPYTKANESTPKRSSQWHWYPEKSTPFLPDTSLSVLDSASAEIFISRGHRDVIKPLADGSYSTSVNPLLKLNSVAKPIHDNSLGKLLKVNPLHQKHQYE